MAFLAPDERLIVMDINRRAYAGEGHDYGLTADEMRQLRDIGIRTVLQQMWWDAIERERGVRDWAPVEVGLERARAAGMRVLLGCYQRPPTCLPAEWYLHSESGENLGHLSLWNDEANEYEAEFVRELAGRYAGPDVLLQNTLICDGETMLPKEPSWHDPAGLASFREWCGQGAEPSVRRAYGSGWLGQSVVEKMLRYQGLLLEVQDHGEVWVQLHPMIEKRSTGTQYVADVLAAMRAEWPEVSICWLLYTFYEFGAEFRKAQIELARGYGVRLFVGAGHCEGLARSVPRAKGSGLGLLCGPRHDLIMPDQKELEGWMVERLAWAVGELGGRGVVEAAVVVPAERAVGVRLRG